MDKSPPGQRDDAVSPLSILQVELCGPTQPPILLLPSRCQPSFLAIARVSEAGTQEERPGGTPSLIRTERHSLVTVQLASGSEADNMWLKESRTGRGFRKPPSDVLLGTTHQGLVCMLRCFSCVWYSVSSHRALGSGWASSPPSITGIERDLS